MNASRALAKFAVAEHHARDECLQGVASAAAENPSMRPPQSRSAPSPRHAPVHSPTQTQPDELKSCVRWRTKRSSDISAACCSALFIGTNRIDGRVTASQIAAASAPSRLSATWKAGDVRDFSAADSVNSRRNFARQPFDTGALPHFEQPTKCLESHDRCGESRHRPRRRNQKTASLEYQVRSAEPIVCSGLTLTTGMPSCTQATWA
jgi:hypothetical protein